MRLSVIALMVSILVGVLFADCARAQQSTSVSTAAQRSNAAATAPSRFEIRRNFLTIDRADLTRRARQLERCIRNARENLTDIQGNINRVAQTDLINCSRALEMLLRKQQRLTRRASRLETEAQLEAEIIAQTLQRASRVLNIPSSQSRTPGFLPQ